MRWLALAMLLGVLVADCGEAGSEAERPATVGSLRFNDGAGFHKIDRQGYLLTVGGG
jgi:hypothetical protein